MATQLANTFDIKIARGSGCEDHLREGWSWIEADRVWAVANESIIMLPSVSAPAAGTLRVRIASFVNRYRPIQRLKIFVNNFEVGNFELDSLESRTLEMPIGPGMLSDRLENEIRLYHPDGSRPSDSGHGDFRNLSICLFWISVSIGGQVDIKNSVKIRDQKYIPDNFFPDKPNRQDLFEVNSFESIGTDCEFGLFQRMMGIEPLGLLRFAGIRFHDVCNILEGELTDIGDDIRIDTSANDNEICIMESKYNFRYHTFTFIGQVDESILLRKQGRYLKFLANKLKDDLSVGEKIYVYKMADHVPDHLVEKLYELLQRYGNNTLLVVRLADENHSAGDVNLVHDRLWNGYVTKFLARGEQSTSILKNDWLSLCKEAYRKIRKS